MADTTREQLQTMGLSEEQINAILGVTNQESGEGLPFPILKVNYDADLGKLGAFGYNPQKNEDGFIESYEKTFDVIKATFLKSVYQYSAFDANTNQVSVVSNIFESLKDAKNAIDTKSGLPISELKETNDNIKLQRISLVKLEDTGDVAVWFLKGKYLFELNEELRKHKNEGHLTKTFTIRNKKQKKGSVTYFIPEISVEDRNMLETIKEDSEYITKFNNWALKEVEVQPKKRVNEAPEIDVDEDDIIF